MPIYKMDGKKNGKQQYKVRINYVDSLGKAKQMDRIAYGSAEAKELEQRLLYEVNNKTTVNLKKTVVNLYEEYLDHKKHELRATTLDKVIRTLRLNVIDPLGHMKLDALSSPVLQKWKNEISERDISIRTKQNIYKEFNALLNFAVKYEYLPKNPLSILGNFKDVYFTHVEEKLKYYTKEQFQQYIAVAKAECTKPEHFEYYVFFNIAFYTGLRKGEINALKWSDIEGNLLHVRRSIAQKLKGDDIETPPKNKASYRTLQMPIPLMNILNEHKAKYMRVDGFTDEFRICGGTRCLRDTSISKRNIKYAELAGLPAIRIHDFRHSHATLLANEGINIQEIARRLGHSKIEVTWNTYAHLYPREEERAVKVLNDV